MATLQLLGSIEGKVPVISCTKCDSWVQWNDSDPRRKVEGHGFKFLGDLPSDDPEYYGEFECDCIVTKRAKDY